MNTENPIKTTDASSTDSTATTTATPAVKVKKVAVKKAVVKVADVKPAKKVIAPKAKAVPAKKAPVKVAKPAAKKVAPVKAKVTKVAAKPAKKVAPVKAAKKSVTAEKRTADNFDRNFGRLKVNGNVLSKGRAVLAVVAGYNEAKKPTLAQLKDAFPDALLKNYGIIKEATAARKYSSNGKTRYFVAAEDLIKTKDGKTIAVCNQFSTENVKPFIKHAKTLGFTMTPAVSK